MHDVALGSELENRSAGDGTNASDGDHVHSSAPTTVAVQCTLVLFLTYRLHSSNN